MKKVRFMYQISNLLYSKFFNKIAITRSNRFSAKCTTSLSVIGHTGELTDYSSSSRDSVASLRGEAERGRGKRRNMRDGEREEWGWKGGSCEGVHSL